MSPDDYPPLADAAPPGSDDTPRWPSPPPIPAADANIELLKILYTAQVAEVAAARGQMNEEAKQGWERELADKAADAELVKNEHDAMLAVAKASIDRARAGAEAVRNAAAALGTLYTSVLGVAFAVGHGKPLPGRGVIPAFFLGLATVFATAYVAFVWPGQATRRVPSAGGTLRAQQDARMATFILWTSEVARRGAWTLHLAVLSLGLGVAALPLPFVAWSGSAPWVAAGVALLLAVLISAVTGAISRGWRPQGSMRHA